jgi:NAD/NADP transhydrogenase alpha subunit
MVRQGDLKSQLIAVGTAAVTVTGAIPINSIRGVYGLKISELSGAANKLYMDRVLGATVTAVDLLPLVAKEVQDWPGHEVTEKSLPFWRFEEAQCDHIQFTALAASVEVTILFADEHA